MSGYVVPYECEQRRSGRCKARVKVHFYAERVKHKVLSLAFRAVRENRPAYLTDLIRLYCPSRSLRSADQSLLAVPGPRVVKTKRYGQRAFSYIATILWNALPRNIRETNSISSFRSSLKTFLFSQ